MRRHPRTASRVVVSTLVVSSVLALSACQGQSQSREAGPVADSMSSTPSTAVTASVPEEVAEAQAPVTADGIASEPPLAAVSAYAVDLSFMRRQSSMQGQWASGRVFPALYSLLACAYDCRGQDFMLPIADGPLTKVTAGPGTVQWRMTTEGYYPGQWPSHVYPGQVYFTAANSGGIVGPLREKGFVEITLGEQVAEGLRAFVVPTTWPAPTMPAMGELRLFASGAPAPRGFVPADGRTVPVSSNVGRMLVDFGYASTGGAVALPDLKPIDGYRWMIATEGIFPGSM